jgi:hypothetical protein
MNNPIWLTEDDRGKATMLGTEHRTPSFPVRYPFITAMISGGIIGALLEWRVTVPALWPISATLFALAFMTLWLRNGSQLRNYDRLHNIEKLITAPAKARDSFYVPSLRDDPKEDPQERIGDAERDDVIRQLAMHFSAGRLALDEHDERTSTALKAKTHQDLKVLLHRLPVIDDKGELI